MDAVSIAPVQDCTIGNIQFAEFPWSFLFCDPRWRNVDARHLILSCPGIVCTKLASCPLRPSLRPLLATAWQIHRLIAMAHQASDQRTRIEKLCRNTTTVSSNYAEEPEKSPGHIAEQLYGTHHLGTVTARAPDPRKTCSDEDLEWARRCGKFEDTKPSELFLRAFHDLLQCLDQDGMANCVSPPLCGSTGFVPMTIIAPLNDQMRHMSNLIVRARKEVLLATNFWKASGASTFINDALIELSKRAGERAERVVVKLMFDRGDIKQASILNHLH